MVWTIIGGGDTQTLLAGKKTLNFMHSRVDVKTFSIPSAGAISSTSLALMLEPPGETVTT